MHFEYKEKALYEVGYEDLLNHKKIHGQLLKKAQEIRDNVEKETIDGMKAFAYIFEEIIVGHLLSEDTRFYSCFK